jgi:hypothetical protein
MNNNSFQSAFAKAALEHGIDADKIRADEKMMMLCIDLYYNGGLDGIHRFNKSLEEKKNVAVSPIPASTLS